MGKRPYDEVGCMINENDRPLQCRMLMPNDDMHNCRSPEEFTKEAMAMKWLDYQEQIAEAYDLYAEGVDS